MGRWVPGSATHTVDVPLLSQLLWVPEDRTGIQLNRDRNSLVTVFLFCFV